MMHEELLTREVLPYHTVVINKLHNERIRPLPELLN